MSSASDSDRPYILVSADTHCGASIEGYKPYLESRWHDRFDEWAGTFHDAWSDVDESADPEHRMGVASFGSMVNWDSPAREADLEREGVAGEILYPNTVPPFYPSGVITAGGPRDREMYERRMAGLRAHNRWLRDFAGLLPNRRVGLAQVFVVDLDDTIAEVRRAREFGLGGVLLPAQHFDELINWYLPKYDRLWAVCEGFEMPVHFHLIVPSAPASEEAGDASPAVGLFEMVALGQRPLAHFILGGIFERFPKLQVVLTENFVSWIPDYLARLDLLVATASDPKDLTHDFAYRAVSKLKQKPSEYFTTNCHAATFFTRPDIKAGLALGTDRLMWGFDYPHHESTFPHTLDALRINFSHLPEPDVRRITGGNAIKLYGMDEAVLQRVADRIGPKPSDVATPLAKDDWPTNHPCPTFARAASLSTTS